MTDLDRTPTGPAPAAAVEKPAPAVEKPAPAVGKDYAPIGPPPPWPGRLDHAMRVGGFVLALLLTLLSALFEAFLAPLYWGETRLPVAILAAVVGNLGVAWFTVVVTGRRLAVAGPALLWVGVMLVAAGRTEEGDLVLAGNNWVGTGTLLAGSLAFGLAGYRLILAGARPPRSGPDRLG